LMSFLSCQCANETDRMLIQGLVGQKSGFFHFFRLHITTHFPFLSLSFGHQTCLSRCTESPLGCHLPPVSLSFPLPFSLLSSSSSPSSFHGEVIAWPKFDPLFFLIIIIIIYI